MKNIWLKGFVPIMLGFGSTVALAGNSTVPLKPVESGVVKKHEHGLETTDHKAPTKSTIFKINESKNQQLAVSEKVISSDCDLSQFMTDDAQQLINAIETQGVDCINRLFTADSQTKEQTYTSENMITAANRVQSLSAGYSGNGDEDIQSYFLFIRAGYFVEFYNDNVSFTSNVTPAVKVAIDQFATNPYFYSNSDEHGKVLGEVIITMDSSGLQHEYIHVIKNWLSRWDESYAANWNMRSAVNNVFTLLFRGQWNDQFVAKIGSDTQLVTDLRNFTMKSWMIDSDAEFMINNAAAELSRLKMYSNTAIQPSVDSGLEQIFNTYEMYGYGDGIWLNAANNADHYADCADYGICGFKDELEVRALSQNHSCSDTIKIRSQDMSTEQFQAACEKLGVEENLFHNMMQTNQQPVADDYNDFLQVNIFDSDTDYKKYAGIIFGISTDNGGMYLEGDPSVQDNQANFVAYEASYGNPDHYVWNLEHEYVHYLDGRFNLYGGFNAPTEAVVWWTEGAAEYVSKLDDNQAAIDTIKDGSTYSLSEVFETTYNNGDSDRIYHWGYLAVRFMFENHPDEVQKMRAATRPGNWSQYKSLVNGWVSSYGSEFEKWVQQLAGQNPDNQKPVVEVNGPYSGNVGQSIAFNSSGSSDPDGSIVSYSWDFGDGTSSTAANPTHSYSATGQYSVTLTVTDNGGATASATALVTITDNALVNGEPVMVSGGQGSQTTFTLEVPQGATELTFQISGGAGDADLYVRYGSEPTLSDYDCRPYIGGNNEICNITDIQAGTYYVMLVGYNSFSDMSLTGSFTAQSNIPNACQTQNPVSGGRLYDDQPTCLASQDPMWFSIADMSGHQSVAISVGNGSGDLKLEYSNSGWPSGTNVDAISDNEGNNECIYVTNQTQYWGYVKISGQSQGATIVVDYDATGCR